MFATVRRFALITLISTLTVGCSLIALLNEPRALGPGEHWLPAVEQPLPSGVEDRACDGVGLVGATLHGSPTDPRLAWMEGPMGRVELVWPRGYSARFNPQLEVLDDADQLIATERVPIIGACGTPDPKLLEVDASSFTDELIIPSATGH